MTLDLHYYKATRIPAKEVNDMRSPHKGKTGWLKMGIAVLAMLLVATLGSARTASANALLIEDGLPWNTNSNSTTLAPLGIPFTKIASNTIGAYTLSDYDFVVFASVQNQSFYDNVAANFAAINSYVQGGRQLIAHSALWGWPGNGLWNPPNFLPGGVGRVQEYSNSVNVTDPSHPVVSGPYGTVTEAEFQGWNYTTHGYFTDLVAGTHIVLDLNDLTKPIYIEYAWGAGIVRATMMTVEWGSNDPWNTRWIFRQNEFYAAQNPPGAIPEPSTILLLGAGLVGLGLWGRKRMAK